VKHSHTHALASTGHLISSGLESVDDVMNLNNWQNVAAIQYVIMVPIGSVPISRLRTVLLQEKITGKKLLVNQVAIATQQQIWESKSICVQHAISCMTVTRREKRDTSSSVKARKSIE
jgi:hypothetical protein